MKVAVLSPHMAVKGPMTWAFELASGFRDLGHHCDVVTSTKSGRMNNTESAARWNTWIWHGAHADVCAKDQDLGDVLAGYDLVVLDEPKNITKDKMALSARKKLEKPGDETSLPAYVIGLEKAKRWTCALHGPGTHHYAGKGGGHPATPFVEELFGTPGWSGVIFTPAVNFVDGIPWAAAARFVHVPGLPYRLKFADEVTDVGPRTGVVGTLGRQTHVKGSPLLVKLANERKFPQEVELWGAGQVFRGMVFARMIREYLAREGWEWRFLDREYTSGPWEARRGDQRVRLGGKYPIPGISLEDVMTSFDTFISLTNRDFSRTLLEFTGLEALDAGRLAIFPDYMVPPEIPYVVRKLRTFERGPNIANDDTSGIRWNTKKMSAEAIARVEDEVCDAIEAARIAATKPELVRDLGRQNREVIRRCNDPRLLAGRMIEEVM